MEFKIKKNGSTVNTEILIVSYDKEFRHEFPPPYTAFILEIDGKEYETSIRNLKSEATSLAKTIDTTGKRITRNDLCVLHSLVPGQSVYIKTINPQNKYRLTRSS